MWVGGKERVKMTSRFLVQAIEWVEMPLTELGVGDGKELRSILGLEGRLEIRSSILDMLNLRCELN